MGILEKLEKRRDALRAKNGMKPATHKVKHEVVIALSPTTLNGEKRVKDFQPKKSPFFKSYVVNEQGVGLCTFTFPMGIPEIMKYKVAEKIKKAIDENAGEDVSTEVFL